METYPKYKDSGVEWIGKIPSHWKFAKLKRITQFLYGDSLSNENRIEGDVPVYGSNGITGFHNQSITNCPCIIIGRKGSFGKINYSEIPCFPIDTTYFIDKSATQNNIRWLYYALQILGLDLISKDSAVPGLSREDACDKFSLLVPLEEQQAIVNFLDRETGLIDNLIGKKKRQIELLKEQRTAIINQAVTKGLEPNVKMKDSGIEWLGKIPEHWEVKKIRYLFNMNTGLSITKEELQESGIPCVNYGEIHTKYGFDLDLSRDELKYVDEKYIISNNSALVSENDFVFCDTSEDIKGSGNCVYISKVSGSKIFAGSHTIIARPIFKVNSRYLAFLFMATSWRAQIQSKVFGIKVYSITQKILKDVIATLPPFFEQKQISDFLDRKTGLIDGSISKSENQIQLLQEYRTALISEAVTGKIDVRKVV